jgi:uncharacterized protein YndB with AHSA1/START domain
MSIVHSEFTIERRYPHAPARAFSAFADPELKTRWFRTPDTWTEREYELDFRAGGHEVSRARDDEGTHHAFHARIHDVVQDERIVFAYDLLLDGRLVSVSLTTIEFRAAGEGTHLLFTEQGAFFDDLEDPALREHGTGELLKGLDAFLADAGAEA